jgi:hypothetical protein
MERPIGKKATVKKEKEKAIVKSTVKNLMEDFQKDKSPNTSSSGSPVDSDLP